MPTSTSPSPSQSPIPRSGILTTPTGDRHIPQSTRADGSLRKEIKIRPGYRPPEDVEVYKNRTAEAWKTRGTGGVPGAEGLKESEDGKSSIGKNAKRREARKRAKAADGEEDDNESLVNENAKVQENRQSKPDSKPEGKSDWRVGGPSPSQAPESEPEADPEAEKEKQARNLKKKLRQARELREKKDKGENLLPEQFEKVIKIQELIRQLDSLGFESDGAERAKDTR
ncbi:MAG: hypothetical protein ASARMPREDX12_001514 [Alectoria sarmentosa]|nr:MAG: hypothetical protein ASARMPREDX12_001514 [Alectoria sarmentosa]CAD6593444.1 MAG: hypothetical protein ASARMPRED_007515 [Alectoria sarmentosa]